MIPFAVSFSALGLVGNQLWQWTALCVVMSLFQVAISQTAWVAGVIPRFHASRGMALAVALAGLGLSSFIWPPIAAVFIDQFGWRAAFPAIALVYTIVALPLTVIYFHSPERPEPAAQAAQAGRHSYAKEMLSRSFVGLVLAGALFAGAYYGLVVHFVPVLTNSGIGFTAAAGIVAIVGLASMAGRLLSGLLLDALPTRAVALAAFLLPLAAVALLIGLPGSVPGAIAAVLALGLASGAELNIITYIAARRFGPEVFGSIYAMFMAIIAIGASFGPVLAGALFDARGSYHFYLLMLAPIFLAATALIAWVPISPHEEVPDA